MPFGIWLRTATCFTVPVAFWNRMPCRSGLQPVIAFPVPSTVRLLIETGPAFCTKSWAAMGLPVSTSDRVRDQACGGRQNHGGIASRACNPFESKVLGDYHLFGVSAGANFDYASGGNRIYRQLNGSEMDKRRAGADGDCCGKGVSAECDKHDQSQTRERATTSGLH